MVSFICNACGQTVKKNQVEKHYQSDCPNCEVLSCIDCGKDFHGSDYSAHTSCISEAEKYQGKLFKPKDKQNKGEQKQQEWIKHVKEASGADNATSPKIRGLLEKISEYSNVPRKKAKFQNFCRNSLRVRDDVTLDQLWEIFSASVKGDQKTATDTVDATNGDSKEKEISSEISERNGTEGSEEKRKSSKKKEQSDSSVKSDKDEGRKGKKRKQKHSDEHGSEKSQKKSKRKRRGDEEYEEKTADNPKIDDGDGDGDGDGDEAVNVVQGMFSWKITIKKVLKGAPDHELPLKKLRKKVLAEFLARGGDNKHRTENELRALFDKKVTKNPLFKVHKERVKLC